MKYFLLIQGEGDKNSSSYLRKLQRKSNEKDE
jgi:hypothetical protein